MDVKPEERLSVYDLDRLVRAHAPGFAVFHRSYLEGHYENLIGYGVELSWARADLLMAMERLNQVAAMHDAALARKDYDLSDALRKALDISPIGQGRTRKEIETDYAARFDVPAKKSVVRFVATPPM